MDYFDFCIQIAEAHSEPSQTSKMEVFAKILKVLKMPKIFLLKDVNYLSEKLHLRCLAGF